MGVINMKSKLPFLILALALQVPAVADEAAARRWVEREFQPSTLPREQQVSEMKWFIDAAARLKAQGVREISVVSETLTVHEYESRTLARAFEEITGIKVKHDLLQEGDVVEKLQTSMQSGKSIYDGWISDSDLIGTHHRYGVILPLTDYMAGAGKAFTNPGLDLNDFIGTRFTTAPDGKLYSCPTSSSRTSTGSAPTGSRAPTSRSVSAGNTAMNSACRRTGAPTRT
jgi:glycerol transport system substrate-binding protein